MKTEELFEKIKSDSAKERKLLMTKNSKLVSAYLYYRGELGCDFKNEDVLLVPELKKAVGVYLQCFREPSPITHSHFWGVVLQNRMFKGLQGGYRSFADKKFFKTTLNLLTVSDVDLLEQIALNDDFVVQASEKVEEGDTVAFTAEDVKSLVDKISTDSDKEDSLLRYGPPKAKLVYISLLEQDIHEDNIWFLFENGSQLLTSYIIQGKKLPPCWEGKFRKYSSDALLEIFDGVSEHVPKEVVDSFTFDSSCLDRKDFRFLELCTETSDLKGYVMAKINDDLVYENNLFDLENEKIIAHYVDFVSKSSGFFEENNWRLLENENMQALCIVVKNGYPFSRSMVEKFYEIAPLRLKEYYKGVIEEFPYDVSVKSLTYDDMAKLIRIAELW